MRPWPGFVASSVLNVSAPQCVDLNHRSLKLLDSEAKEHTVINPNVLIEIGAAMALYGRRFILLVREGVKLPSNLQGLYEVRYQGEALDGAVTIRLLKAINEMKSVPLPAGE
ncbi:MAG: hypothetical protein EPN61_03510 [Burkholderiaceae bacterium]|nr:MAG: hypothetical protein EPN61_03510 [Burkholderiaceae bacterium]